jgi:FAD-dependent urate hydroxylase
MCLRTNAAAERPSSVKKLVPQSLEAQLCCGQLGRLRGGEAQVMTVRLEAAREIDEPVRAAEEGPVQAAVVGAGPYGLSVAAHLQAAGVEARIFGDTMAFWKRNMPVGMLLRSGWHASHVSDPAGKLTLDDYVSARGEEVARPIPLADFVEYGEWFRRGAGLDVDPRLVRRIARADGLFHLTLEDGTVLRARSVVVATGLERFDWRPPEFTAFPPHRLSHSSEHTDFSAFAGRRVAVVGGGQSAAESAALLHEAGAEVTLATRQPRLHWLAPGRLATRQSLRRVLYPPSDVGPPGLNWLVATPGLLRTLPRGLQRPVSTRVLRPAVSDWLGPRLKEVTLELGRTIVGAHEEDDTLTLELDNGGRRQVDHLLLATGYRVDISRLPFLADLVGALGLAQGSPPLGRGFESNVPGLHFVGAAATESFGPLMRFVAGTGYAASAVTARLCGSRAQRSAR